MNKTEILVLLGAAAVAYFYLSSGTTGAATVQNIPGLNYVYNIGFNFSNSGSFSTASPV